MLPPCLAISSPAFCVRTPPLHLLGRVFFLFLCLDSPPCKSIHTKSNKEVGVDQALLITVRSQNATLYMYWRHILLPLLGKHCLVMFIFLPGSTAIYTLVMGSVFLPVAVALSVSGPAVPVFVSFPFPLSFPLPFPLLLPFTVPPLSLPLPLLFPLLPLPLKLQPLFLPLVLFFFEFLQSRTESGSANDPPDMGRGATITLLFAQIKWFPDINRCLHTATCTNQFPACKWSWGSNQKPQNERVTLRKTQDHSSGSFIYSKSKISWHCKLHFSSNKTGNHFINLNKKVEHIQFEALIMRQRCCKRQCFFSP